MERFFAIFSFLILWAGVSGLCAMGFWWVWSRVEGVPIPVWMLPIPFALAYVYFRSVGAWNALLRRRAG
jgi:hypothetical protein